ncbi:hypothetical protein F5Y07DRAFT_354876 [Xylaria sp. FL0933]|nr:hypothetical protein F5Y07DRAFT_354876 [Xylaria sp. FL0933]
MVRLAYLISYLLCSSCFLDKKSWAMRDVDQIFSRRGRATNATPIRRLVVGIRYPLVPSKNYSTVTKMETKMRPSYIGTHQCCSHPTLAPASAVLDQIVAQPPHK